MKRVAIIHPWMPQYRIAFFEKLKLELALHQIELDVFYGEPELSWKVRNDQQELSFGTRLPTRQFRIGSRTLLFKSLKLFRKKEPYDLVVAEHAIRNFETFGLMVRGVPIAFWGHGRTYTQSSIRVLEKFKEILALRGKWFFSYTDGGREHLVKLGYPSSKISVLNNTIDTTALKASLQRVSQESVATFRSVDLAGGKKVALFLGALDKSKKLDFLFDSLDIVAQKNKDFRFLIVGDGAERDSVIAATQTRPWATYVGNKFGGEKALYLAASDVLVVPGRVGLVVIDSFVAGVPIVTTKDEFHPPEFEYLADDRNAIIAGQSCLEYADAVLSAISDEAHGRLSQDCLESAAAFSMESMVANFTEGVVRCLTSTQRT